MASVPQIERMRVLRRDSYRCQVRLGSGAPCLQPTARVVYRNPDGPAVQDNLKAACHGPH